MAVDDLNDLITQADAARLRAVSREAIADLITRGRLQTVEIAGQRFVRRSEIENFEERKAGRPPKEATATKASQKKGKK